MPFSQSGSPKSYLGKIMLVAFLGIHIPLLTLFCYAIVATTLPATQKAQILLIALFATLIGTALTLYTLHNLLAPISATFTGLRRYLEKNIKPQLPTHFTDEAGILMADTMYAIDKLDETIQHLKHYDRLTALPNRTLFHSRLKERLMQLANHPPDTDQILAVLVLDLDNFSNLNNNLGQKNGDQLLYQVAQRLLAHECEGRLIARIGGDEFAILCDNYAGLNELITQSKKVLAALNVPFVLGGREHYLTFAAGIAYLRRPRIQAETLCA